MAIDMPASVDHGLVGRWGERAVAGEHAHSGRVPDDKEYKRCPDMTAGLWKAQRVLVCL